jgi:hypothetical protein
MKIESLTPEQTARFGEYVDKCIAIGMNTDKVDLDNAKLAVCKAYRLADLKEPTTFHVVDSPIAAVEFIQTLDPSKSKSDILNEMCFGSMDISWISFYKYFIEVVGLDLEKIGGLHDLTYHTGWYNAYEDVVVFQHRPEYIKMDDTNRLHCENGPAIRYRDGYSLYSWHGTRIPSEWIENKASLTPEIALTWSNIEQRRCAAEILGWDNVIRQLNHIVIDEDGDPEIGTLLEVDIPEIGREKFLRVKCGTGRMFCIPVPPDMKTAIEAQAWTWDLTVEDFGVGPEIRT